MDDKRNLILAVLLTGLILFGWPYVAERLFPGSTKPAVTQQQSAPQTPQSGANAPGAPALAPSMPTTPLSRATVLTQSPRVVIETPKLTGSIALKGARIDDITLPTYRETVKKDSPPIRLFSPAGTQNAYFAGFGWAGEGVKAPDANTVWQASGQKLTPTSPVTLRWNNGVGQLFEIALSVDANYMITARQSVTNRSAGAVAVRSYGFISRAGHSKDPSTWTIHTGPIGVFNEAANYDIEFETLDEDGISERLPSTGGCIGFTDHY